MQQTKFSWEELLDAKLLCFLNKTVYTDNLALLLQRNQKLAEFYTE